VQRDGDFLECGDGLIGVDSDLGITLFGKLIGFLDR